MNLKRHISVSFLFHTFSCLTLKPASLSVKVSDWKCLETVWKCPSLHHCRKLDSFPPKDEYKPIQCQNYLQYFLSTFYIFPKVSGVINASYEPLFITSLPLFFSRYTHYPLFPVDGVNTVCQMRSL